MEIAGPALAFAAWIRIVHFFAVKAAIFEIVFRLEKSIDNIWLEAAAETISKAVQEIAEEEEGKLVPVEFVMTQLFVDTARGPNTANYSLENEATKGSQEYIWLLTLAFHGRTFENKALSDVESLLLKTEQQLQEGGALPSTIKILSIVRRVQTSWLTSMPQLQNTPDHPSDEGPISWTSLSFKNPYFIGFLSFISIVSFAAALSFRSRKMLPFGWRRSEPPPPMRHSASRNSEDDISELGWQASPEIHELRYDPNRFDQTPMIVIAPVEGVTSCERQTPELVPINAISTFKGTVSPNIPVCQQREGDVPLKEALIVRTRGRSSSTRKENTEESPHFL